MIDKNVTIEEKHDEFAEDLRLNLSALLRDKLDEMIEENGWQSTEDMLREQGEEEKLKELQEIKKN